MATYKVLQDIEAEDKLLGPLTLKQFIFAIITTVIGFVAFKIATTTGLSVVRWPFVIVLLIPMVIFGFLAAPIARDQPNDIWLLARVRFLIKPHVRIWNQDGLSQLVTITVPQKIQQILTNGLNQNEVRSRLGALASTLDSRGWAIKNVDVNLFTQQSYLDDGDGTDRLVAASSLPTVTQAIDVHAADDILDSSSNPTAQNLDKMMQDSTANHRQKVLDSVKNSGETNKQQAPADYWFMNKPSGTPASAPSGYTTFQNGSVVAPGLSDDNSAVPTADEKALIAKLGNAKKNTPLYSLNTKVIQPLGQGQSTVVIDHDTATATQAVSASTQTPANTSPTSGENTSNPAILGLASNDDLNVATIARQAQRLSESDGEVVISLH